MIDAREKLLKLIDEFDTAMLVTTIHEGAPHARPMSIVSAEPSGEFWFASAKDAAPVQEVQHDMRCTVTMQGKRQFVALRGAAEIVEDVGKVKDLWSEKLRPWFPIGPTSPRIVLIRFVPFEGEYWDVSGLETLRYAFRAGRAFIQRKPLDEENDRRHASVTL